MARYVKDDQTVSIYALRDMYPHASIPDGGDASMFGWSLLIETPAPEQEYGFTVTESTPVNGVQTWDKARLPDSMVAQTVRASRDQLLSECDWTQAKDILDAVSQPWAVYRQALRDLPAQTGFPWSVVWPVL